MKNKIDINNPDSYVTCPQCQRKMLKVTHWHIKNHGTTVAEFEQKYNLGHGDRVAKMIRQQQAITQKAMHLRYGPEIGQEKWEHYCKLQAETNTFEYKQKTHGWTEEQFKEYNNSRAVTKKNLIARHGKVDGKRKWQEYCDIQKYVGVKLEYFIEKHGEKEGTKIYEDIVDKKLKGAQSACKFSSGISQKFCRELDENIKKINDKHETFFHTKNQEYRIRFKTPNGHSKAASFDFYNLSTNRAVEFFGDYWHGWTFRDRLDTIIRDKTARSVMAYDRLRIRSIEKQHKIDIMVVWEHEYKANPQKCIEECTKFILNGK